MHQHTCYEIGNQQAVGCMQNTLQARQNTCLSLPKLAHPCQANCLQGSSPDSRPEMHQPMLRNKQPTSCLRILAHFFGLFCNLSKIQWHCIDANDEPQNHSFNGNCTKPIENRRMLTKTFTIPLFWEYDHRYGLRWIISTSRAHMSTADVFDSLQLLNKSFGMSKEAQTIAIVVCCSISQWKGEGGPGGGVANIAEPESCFPLKPKANLYVWTVG